LKQERILRLKAGECQLVIGAVVQVAQIAVRIAQHDEVVGFSTQNPKGRAALDLAEARKFKKIIRTDLIHRLMGDPAAAAGKPSPLVIATTFTRAPCASARMMMPAQPMTSSSGCGAKTTIEPGRVDLGGANPADRPVAITNSSVDFMQTRSRTWLIIVMPLWPRLAWVKPFLLSTRL
jgi:hypothetical protein